METLGETKCVEETEVDIVEYTNSNNFNSYGKEDPDGTEYSSSFADSTSDIDHSLGSSEGEVEMQMFDEKGYVSPFHGFSSSLQMRKKKLTNHWRRFIRPLMWRCRWMELRIKELESQAMKYSRDLETYEKLKLSRFDPNLGSRSFRFSSSQLCRRRNKAMKRSKRVKVEEKTDTISYMTQHNLFSYLESKGSDPHNISPADDLAMTEKNIDDDEKYGNFNGNSVLELRFRDYSFEQILWKLEGVHSRLHKLKNQIEVVMSEHAAKFSSSEDLSLLDSAFSPELSAGNGEVTSAGAIDNSAKDVYVSTTSSYDEVVPVPDIIKSTIKLLAAEVNLPQSQIGDSGECILESVLMDQREGVEEDSDYLNLKAMTSDEQSGPKSCLASDVNFPRSTRQRGERKAGSGSWKKRRSSKHYS